jgi:hypothetical protein
VADRLFYLDFINATICVSVLSIGLSSVYGASRTLVALAETGYAPKFFAYVDKSSRPLWSVVFVLAFGALGYINVVAAGNIVCMYPCLHRISCRLMFFVSYMAPRIVRPLHPLHMALDMPVPHPLPQSMGCPRPLGRGATVQGPWRGLRLVVRCVPNRHRLHRAILHRRLAYWWHGS